MKKTKPPTTLADLGQSLKLLGLALVETAALRSSVLLERAGILSTPHPAGPKPRRQHPRRRTAH